MIPSSHSSAPTPSSQGSTSHHSPFISLSLPSPLTRSAMKFGEKYTHQSMEIELYGVLQKRNKNGFYQNRYLRTKGCYLQYWTSYEKYRQNNEELPSASYNIKEIQLIEMQQDGSHNFVIQFMNKKFKLELKGISDENCIEWIEFLNAKRSLYSTNSLLDPNLHRSGAAWGGGAEGEGDGGSSLITSLKTNTFVTLLKLTSEEQNNYINDLMNDIFEMTYDDNRHHQQQLQQYHGGGDNHGIKSSSSVSNYDSGINSGRGGGIDITSHSSLSSSTAAAAGGGGGGGGVNSIPPSNIFYQQNQEAKAILNACKQCLEDFTVTCEECALEMTARVPQVIAQCRDYMRRYAELFKSRLSLELNPYFSLSLSPSDIHSLGDECLIEAICFFTSLDTLRQHKFLPRTFFSSIRETLYSSEQLTREFLKMLVIRNESWYEELLELQPRQRGPKLCEYYKIVDYQIKKIDNTFVICDLYDMKSKQTLLMMTIDTLAISMARLVGKTTFHGYGEEALLGHILACQECVRYFSTLKLSRNTTTNVLFDDKMKREREGEGEEDLSISISQYASRERSQSYATESYTGQEIPSPTSSSSHSGATATVATTPTGTGGGRGGGGGSIAILALSKTCIEQLGTIFLQSAANAATGAVHNMLSATQDIVNLFLNERNGEEWIGGKVSTIFLDRVTSWMEGFCQRGSSKPCEFHRIVRRETIRSVVITYLRKLIEKYRNNKRFQLSSAGETQVASDLKMIGRWVEIQNEKLIPIYILDRGSYTGSNDVTMIIKYIRMFIEADESNLMICFIESIQHFGIDSAPHLYDLVRLALKIRSDLPKKVRISVLSCFSSYIEQLGHTSLEDLGPLTHPHPRLSGPDILKELCPRVGEYHCTGKRWSYEQSDNKTKLEMANLVTDACNVARIRRLGFNETTTTTTSASSSAAASQRDGRTSQFISRGRENSTEYDGWQLLDPDAMKLSSNPLDDPHRSITLPNLLHGNMKNEDRHHRHRSASISDAIDNISVLDHLINTEDTATGATTVDDSSVHSVYSYDVKRPLIDLYGCSFEELHLSLCPPMYSLRNSSRKYVFLSSIKPEEHEKMTSFEELEQRQGDEEQGKAWEAEETKEEREILEIAPSTVSFVETDPLEDDGIASSRRSSSVDEQRTEESVEINDLNDIHGTPTLTELPCAPPPSPPPPEKPPKPRRYSIPKSETPLEGESLEHDLPCAPPRQELGLDLMEQWKSAQEHLPERCRLPSAPL
jgi:hypothetical protein